MDSCTPAASDISRDHADPIRGVTPPPSTSLPPLEICASPFDGGTPDIFTPALQSCDSYSGQEPGGDIVATHVVMSRAASEPPFAITAALRMRPSSLFASPQMRRVRSGAVLNSSPRVLNKSLPGGEYREVAGTPSRSMDTAWVMSRVTTDGRFEFDIKTPVSKWASTDELTEALGVSVPGLQDLRSSLARTSPHLAPFSPLLTKSRKNKYRPTAMRSISAWHPPRLTIVILIVGTRGDVQPFLALGCALKDYGHRVRLATHETYRQWVGSYGLEFYPLGGDPKVLSEYIVRNRGILPSGISDVTAQREQLTKIIESTYPACTAPDQQGINQPFLAEAIISNPPAYGHIHCAEKLAIPLHVFFTMPWSPTKAFPHPLASIPNADSHAQGYVNKLSYFAVEDLVWAGNVDIINKFRERTLGLEPIRYTNQGAHMLHQLEVPITYCWSPSLVPKPSDWGDHIDVVGFFFLNEATRTNYEPPEDLKEFLEAGPPPIYIGFGSLVVDDPKHVTSIVFKTAHRTGARVLLSKGWGGLGDGFTVPDNIFLLDSCPHDWLFPKCFAVVHHGGAGTTSAGLLAGCPTTIIPFFGDQTFWGEACNRAGVAPAPIPIDALSTRRLVAAIEFMRAPEVKAAAIEMAARMAAEDGVNCGMASFHRQMSRFKESLESDRAVDWVVPRTHVVGGVYGGAGAMLYETSGAVAGVFKDIYKTCVQGGWKAIFCSDREVARGFIARLHHGAMMFHFHCQEWLEKKRFQRRTARALRSKRRTKKKHQRLD